MINFRDIGVLGAGVDPNTLTNLQDPTGTNGAVLISESGETWVWNEVTDLWVMMTSGSGADKFHSNIVGIAPYDPLNPLTGWVAPSSPISGNTVEVKFTDGVIGNYTFDGTVWGLDFVDDTSTAQRPWIKVGNTTETSATDVLKTDEIYHLADVRIGSSDAPLANLHVGDHNNNPSTDAKVLVSHNVLGPNAEHAFSDGSIINNGNSYNSFDARITINSNLIGINRHYAAFQSSLTQNSGTNLLEYNGHFDGAINNGTIQNYYFLKGLTPGGNYNNFTGLDINKSGNAATVSSKGVNITNLTGPIVDGIVISGLSGTTTTRGLSITNMSGTLRRPIYSEHNEIYSPNEFKFTQSGNADLLVFSRGSVNNGEYLGMAWEAGSGANKYYSNRLASVYNNSLQGDFIFFTNPTGNSGLGSLLEKARIQYDGSFIHEGYHQFTSALATTGATVPNGSIFKGVDGALYYKGGSGTVTLIGAN